jgi:hypothetical protein
VTASLTIPATVTVTALVTETRIYSVKTCKWKDVITAFQRIIQERHIHNMNNWQTCFIINQQFTPGRKDLLQILLVYLNTHSIVNQLLMHPRRHRIHKENKGINHTFPYCKMYLNPSTYITRIKGRRCVCVYIYIYMSPRVIDLLVHHLDQPTGQPTEPGARVPDQSNPARDTTRAPAWADHLCTSRSVPVRANRPRAPRPTRLSYFPS